MSTANGKERLLRLIENAFDGDQAPDSPHVVDDEELLARWSVGAIDPSEREVIIVHLDQCRECRDIVGLMVENGALVLPEPTVPRGIREPVAEHVPVTVPPTERESPLTTPTAREAIAQPRLTAGGQTSSAKYVKLGALAVAASLLGALFILWPRETRLGQSLALTEFDFELDGNSYAMPVHVLAEDTKQRWQAKISRQPHTQPKADGQQATAQAETVRPDIDRRMPSPECKPASPVSVTLRKQTVIVQMALLQRFRWQPTQRRLIRRLLLRYQQEKELDASQFGQIDPRKILGPFAQDEVAFYIGPKKGAKHHAR